MPRLLPPVLNALAAYYGSPAAAPVRSVFEWLVWENVAYLVDDAARARAFSELQSRVGVTPRALLEASEEDLRAATDAGILAAGQAAKLRRIAALAAEDDLSRINDMPLAEAKRVLMRFPSIGQPGAEKILLFARIYPLLGLESNGVRVLTRLGLIRERKTYTQTYRAVQELGRAYTDRGVEWLMRAHQLLRQHGQELCKRTRPRCEQCPLSEDCDYYAGSAGAA